MAAITAGYAIDLHTHSLRSDGALSPADLVKRAAARGVKIQALSDHDTLAGIAEATSLAHFIAEATQHIVAGHGFVGGQRRVRRRDWELNRFRAARRSDFGALVLRVSR